MIGTSRPGSHRKTARRWAATAWIGLVLMLFNVVNGTAMAVRPLAAMAAGDMAICATHHAGAADHHPQAPAHPADCCSCCLSMCCTGAALPDSDPLAVAPPRGWITVAFAAASAAPYNSAPRTGGNARAPPAFV